MGKANKRKGNFKRFLKNNRGFKKIKVLKIDIWRF